jgi:hypothetical protein
MTFPPASYFVTLTHFIQISFLRGLLEAGDSAAKEEKKILAPFPRKSKSKKAV